MNHSYWINAAAGTGKTTKLVERILNLISSTDPKRILCITFTNYAAFEIKQRILQKTGIDDLKVKTIHGFCAELIYQFQNQDLQVIDNVRRDILIKKAISDIFLQSNTKEIQFLASHFSSTYIFELLSHVLCKNPQFQPIFKQTIECEPFKKALEKLPHELNEENNYFDIFLTKQKTIKKRLIKNFGQDVQDEAKNVYQFCQNQILSDWINLNHNFFTIAQRIRDQYSLYKKEKKILDYNDLIEDAIHLIDNQDIVYTLTNTIDHILLDEAQDTSYKQWQFLNKVTQGFFDDATQIKTLFVVGDTSQSIYGFQGAHPDLLHQQKEYYQKQIGDQFHQEDLLINYRSLPKILELVDSCCQTKHITSRTDKGQIFFLNPSENECLEPQLYARYLVDQIQKFLDQEHALPSTQRIAKPEDILILFRKRDDLFNTVIQALQHQNFNISFDQIIPLKAHLFIKDILAFIKFLIDPYDDYALACLVKSPIMYIFDLDIVSDETLAHYCLNREKNLIEIIDFKDILIKKRERFFYNVPCDALIHFHHLVQYYDSNAALAFETFMFEVFHMEQNNVWVNLYQYFIYTKIDVRFYAEKDTMRIMTIHGAKGLQAPVVLLIDASTTQKNDTLWWIHDEVIFSPPATLYNESIESIRSKQKENSVCENNRLLYVALTRAQDVLMIAPYLNYKGLWYDQIKEVQN